jgi:hypothetical protein
VRDRNFFRFEHAQNEVFWQPLKREMKFIHLRSITEKNFGYIKLLAAIFVFLKTG